MTSQTRAGYSGLQIALHWAIALLVLFQLVFGESMVAVVEAMEEGTTAASGDQLLSTLHYWSGLAILGLVVLRAALRWRLGAPAPVGITPLAATLARATHMLFYALLMIVPVTGLLGWYYGDPFGEWHTYAKPVFIVLILVHAGAALYHQFVRKDGTLNRMLSPRDA